MANELAVTVAEPQREIRLGAISVAQPSDVVAQAATVAKELAKVIENAKLSRSISGRKFVYVEGWTTLGAMLGVIPQEDSVKLITGEDGYEEYEAVVNLVRVSDGMVVGRGSAVCGTDEGTWRSRPRYARRSMALTRATGKAFRLGFSWVMTLAGYDPTPAEEMPDDNVIEQEARPIQRKPEPKPAHVADTTAIDAWKVAAGAAKSRGIDVSPFAAKTSDTPDQLATKTAALNKLVAEFDAMADAATKMGGAVKVEQPELIPNGTKRFDN